MSNLEVRKMVTVVEEIHQEMGRDIDPPVRKAAAVAVIENPFAGRYEEDLEPLMAAGEHLGGVLGNRCIEALGIAPGQAESYGKAALVGVDGELEHAAALLHPRMGAPLRKAVEKGAALVPSSKKRGGPGQALDIPSGTQGCGLRSEPLRRHGGAGQRRAARERDHGRGRRHRQRPPAAARGGLDQGPGEGRGRPALSACRRRRGATQGGRQGDTPGQAGRYAPAVVMTRGKIETNHS